MTDPISNAGKESTKLYWLSSTDLRKPCLNLRSTAPYRGSLDTIRRRGGRRRHFRRALGHRRRYAQEWCAAHPAPRHRRAGVEAELPRRRRDLGMRRSRHPSPPRAHRRPAGRMCRARPRPLRAYRRGVQCRGRRLGRVDGFTTPPYAVEAEPVGGGSRRP